MEELWQIVQAQSAELARLRAQRDDPCRPVTQRPITRAGLLKTAAAGAVAAGVGAELLGRPTTARANGSEEATTFTSTSTAGSATVVAAILATTNPGGFSSAVRGKNEGTGGLGIGVWGSQEGSGWGGYFTSVSGIGVNAAGGSGTGVNANGAVGVVANGSEAGLSASAVTGRGVTAAGGAAQLRLVPGPAATHPASGSPGDVYVDSTVKPWFCVGGTEWVPLIAGGPQGAAGARGQTGATGATGPAGSQGPSGPQGPATLRLTPSSSRRPPKAGKAGELFVDSSDRLWFCKKGGPRARWKQIA